MKKKILITGSNGFLGNLANNYFSKDYDLIFFPLGVGHHIDHRILSLIGRDFCRSEYPIVFYEDVPYDLTNNDTFVKK